MRELFLRFHLSRRQYILLLIVSSSITMANTISTPAQFPGQPGPDHHDDPATHAYLGMWVTQDGWIRHQLLPNGRYDEQRGNRKSAYRGRYWVKDDQIFYLDDTGFNADGQFRDGVFHHGGYVFRRVP